MMSLWDAVAGVAIALAATSCQRVQPEPYLRLDAPAPALADAPASRALLVTFWATWCSSCRQEVDQLQKLAADAPPDLTVVVLSEDEGIKDVAAFFGGPPPPELHLRLDPQWLVAHSLYVHQLPTSILVVDGRAIARFEGSRRWSDAPARATLSRLIQGAAPARPNKPEVP